MNRKIFAKLLIVTSIIVFVINSCEDDGGFHQISALEKLIHEDINDHRVANQLNALVFQPILFQEAKKHSMKMANNSAISDEGLDAVFDDLTSKLGGTDAAYILDVSQYAISDSITKGIFTDEQTDAITLGTFTQAGVGVAADDDNINYITILFLNIPD